MTMEMWMFEDRRHRKLLRMRVAVAVIGGSVLTAGVGAAASMSAASTQANAATDATNSANATQLQMYNQTRDDQAPYRQAGYGALNQITQDQANGTGFAKPFNFQQDPGFQFQLDQGNQAIERSAAARGGLLSGAAGKEIAGYTTNLANTSYGDAFNRNLASTTQQYNRLAGIAGVGQTSVAQTGAAGTSTANSVANNTIQGMTGAANARASGYVGVGNALNGAVGSLSNYYMLKNAGMFGSSGAPTSNAMTGGGF